MPEDALGACWYGLANASGGKRFGEEEMDV